MNNFPAASNFAGKLLKLRADFWEGDATKHFSVKKRGFQCKGGRQFSESGVWQGFLQERQFSEEVRAID